MVWTLVRVHLTGSLNDIWNDILIRCMLERKERVIYEVDLLKENHNWIKGVLAGMQRKMQVCLQRNGGHIEGKGN